MTLDPTGPDPIAAERLRTAEIMAIGERFGFVKEARAAIADGTPLPDFQSAALSRLNNQINPILLRDHPMDYQGGRSQRFSIVRMLRDVHDGHTQGTGYEKEVQQELTRAYGAPTSRGGGITFRVPTRETRSVGIGATYAGAGAETVQTSVLGQDFITVLRARTVVAQMGATFLSGLLGNVKIPRQTGAETAYWTTEGNAATASGSTTDQVGLTFKTVSATTRVSRQLLMQSSADVENIVRDSLALSLGVALDAAAITGTGAGGQPTGILNISGVGSVVIGANGGVPTFANIVGLEGAVAAANADMGSLGYIMNSKGRNTLKITPKITGYPTFIYEGQNTDGLGIVNGYRTGVSNNVPGNLTKGTGTNLSAILFGNWSDLLIGEWGTLDVLVNPYLADNTGDVLITAFLSVDIAVRHPQSFAAITDALV